MILHQNMGNLLKLTFKLKTSSQFERQIW